MIAGGKAERRSLLNRWTPFTFAFLSGFCILVIEIAGARLIAPVYGLSAIPWTAVIGVILFAIALGNHLGGRLADSGRIPLWVVLLASGLCSVLPLLGRSVPSLCRNSLGFIPGAVASSAILFAPPVLCLGAVVPYLIQADTHDLREVGRRAGNISAAATAGSILGSFLTGFVFIPLMPVPLLMGLTGALLLLLSGIASRAQGKAVRATLVILAAGLVLLGIERAEKRGLHAEESVYASIQVHEWKGATGRPVRGLFQNGGPSSAEYMDTGEPVFDYLKTSVKLLSPHLERMDHVAVLGGAALTLPLEFERKSTRPRIDVVELDAAVTRIARRYFAFGRIGRPRIHVHHADARLWLEDFPNAFDLLYVDVYDQLLSVPWTMVTVEAIELMAGSLRGRGILAMNIISSADGPQAEFARNVCQTVDRVFSHRRVFVAKLGLPSSELQNLIIVAAHSAEDLPDLQGHRIEFASAGRPLTDDWAPVEYLQSRYLVSQSWFN